MAASRDFPQVIGGNLTNEAKERWARDFKVLPQRRDVPLPPTASWSARSTPQGSVCARAVGHGVVDELPALDGNDEVWGPQVYRCPYCRA